MCKSPLHNFMLSLPKVEHHLHIEGTLSPTLLFTLAAMNSISLPDDPAYASPDALLERYSRFTCLDDFLHYYYLGMSVLRTKDDFELLAWEYFSRVARKDGGNVKHAEIFFDPQAHTSRGVSYDTVVDGLVAAKRRAEAELGITVELIVCILRHLPVPESHQLLDTVLDRNHFSDGTLRGLGMVSSEKNFPPALFKDVYSRAAATGTNLTSHAGEEAGPDFISSSLSELNVTRIDHGLAAGQDVALMKSLAANKTLLTLCPWSNVALRNMKSMEEAPVRKFLDQGVWFSLNSDDPAYFGAYIQDVYCLVQETFDLKVEEWETIVTHSIQGSWCGDERKQVLMGELAGVIASHRQTIEA